MKIDGERRKTSRSTACFSVIAIITALSIIPLFLLFMLFWYSFGRQVEEMFTRGTNPCYPGVLMHVREESVVMIDVGEDIDVEKPKNFFILVNGEPKTFTEITPTELAVLGFTRSADDRNRYVFGEIDEASIWQSRFKFKDTNPNQRPVDLELNRYDCFFLSSDSKIPFSNKPEGPFLTLPAPLDEVLKVFGKPTRWIHEGPHGP